MKKTQTKKLNVTNKGQNLLMIIFFLLFSCGDKYGQVK